VLQGTNPFIQPSLQAIREWMFGPAEALQQEERISVIFIYRARGILAQAPHEFVLGGAALEGDRPPAPTTIVDPGYPVNSVGQGSVIVQVQVSAQGTVERTNVVRPEPSLTDAAVDALKRWKFAPASRGGEARPGLAIAVVTFQAPVLSSPLKQ
jgi:TonB family protein